MFAWSPNNQDFTVTLLSNNSLDKFKDNVQSSFTNYLQTPLLLSPGEWSVGITEVFHNGFINSYQQIDPSPTHDFLYINCDIIEDRIVGDQRVKCLKVIPTSSTKEQMIRFGRIEYYRIGVQHIRGISIIIADQEGQRINFKLSILPTMITLHFTKKH